MELNTNTKNIQNTGNTQNAGNSQSNWNTQNKNNPHNAGNSQNNWNAQNKGNTQNAGNAQNILNAQNKGNTQNTGDTKNTKKFTDKSVIIGIGIIIILIIIFGVVRLKGNSASSDEQKNGNIDGGENVTEISDINLENSALAVASLPQGSMKIQFPVLAGEIFEQGTGKKRGCDTIVFVEKTVPKSVAVLNVTLMAMFEAKEDFGFLPGNFVASQEKLSFDKATIEDGIAKVYLTGEVGPLAGDCDNQRLQIQIEEATLQFDTVNKVEIFLNGQKYESPSEK